MSQTNRDRVNSRRVRTHEMNSGDAVRRLGTMIQSIFCAQSGTSIRLTVWKWSGESRYPGALPPMLENFCRVLPARLTAPGSLIEDACHFERVDIWKSWEQCQLILNSGKLYKVRSGTNFRNSFLVCRKRKYLASETSLRSGEERNEISSGVCGSFYCPVVR